MAHPRNVGWGEMGLDYHYDNSPREIQREVFSRQLRHAVRLGKSITVHTREADEDTERILKAEVPKDHKVLSLCTISQHRPVLYQPALTIL
jgi:TatD DNase family protein